MVNWDQRAQTGTAYHEILIGIKSSNNVRWLNILIKVGTNDFWWAPRLQPDFINRLESEYNKGRRTDTFHPSLSRKFISMSYGKRPLFTFVTPVFQLFRKINQMRLEAIFIQPTPLVQQEYLEPATMSHICYFVSKIMYKLI